jgi:DNA-binding NarL/FixJ family response regulator
MQEEAVYAERALAAGARGYITKQEATENILEAIRQVREGGIYLSQAMSTAIAAAVNPAQRVTGATVASLSDRELQVLEFIGQGLNSTQIAGRMNLSPKTVETYRERIKLKLELKGPTELRQTAIRWVTAGRLNAADNVGPTKR